uniref:NADH-ubiquinone oxidoreductase chain 4L n=1 Tax=Lepidosiren paradoxus TaxID=7883 RepID=Q8WDT2_LEPPA|nr:NADH dehydrogenase subunit 4L [Lepidosiren paradoxa]AAL55253.1 NADH dehydrogenase subunit 4L [Lepidosiren paradoxa]
MTPLVFTFSSTFTVSLIGLAFNRSHLILTLLCLEGMMLSSFLALSTWPLLFQLSSPLPLPLIILSLAACEAATGLALLVATARTHGTDHLKSLNLLRC